MNSKPCAGERLTKAHGKEGEAALPKDLIREKEVTYSKEGETQSLSC